jgi:hypothetical protein
MRSVDQRDADNDAYRVREHLTEEGWRSCWRRSSETGTVAGIGWPD